MATPAAFRVGSDTGGTFTDFVQVDECSGQVFIEKRLTTCSDPSEGMLDGLRALEGAASGYVAATGRMAHATALVANTVIVRKGRERPSLTTRGLRDVLEVRRRIRVTTYELWVDPSEPLVPRYPSNPGNRARVQRRAGPHLDRRGGDRAHRRSPAR